jgi:hypothetical protein
MVAEFDDVARWTADAAEELGVRYALPAACRAAARLFGLPVAAADGVRIPLRTGSVEQVTALIARHRAAPAYALATRQGEQLSRLFATQQISMQLIHAVSRPTTEES